MDASASAQPLDHSHRDAKHRRPQLHNLNVQVPTAPTTNAGCFRPSPTSSSSPSSHSSSYGHGPTDRPASPSLIRSPSAWIKAKGQTFGSAKHARRRSRDMQYDALSYARNFDEGGTDGEGEEEAAARRARRQRRAQAPVLRGQAPDFADACWVAARTGHRRRRQWQSHACT